MKNRTFLITASIVSTLLFLSACKDNTTGPATATDPTGAAAKVTQANQILIPKIISFAETGDTTALDLSSAETLYNEALGLDAANKDAHFGLAIIDILSLGNNPDLRNLAGSWNVPIGPGMLTSITKASLSSYGNLMKEQLFGTFTEPMDRALGKTAASQASNPPSYYQNIIETALLPKLTSAINHLDIVLSNPDYAFLITPQLTNGASSETYRIDATEIYLLKAVLHLVVGEGSAAVAYNIDYDPSDSAAVYMAWQPGSAFLTLRTNGSQSMKNVRTNFIGAASSIQSSLNHLMTEAPNPETDLINYNPADHDAFVEVISGLDSLKTALSGPMAFSGGPTVNFMNFFDDAIPDYKQMVPGYTVSVAEGFNPGTYDATLTWTAASFDAFIFPDPTMRGLFPGMTDPDLKTWLDLSAATWEPTVVIPGS